MLHCGQWPLIMQLTSTIICQTQMELHQGKSQSISFVKAVPTKVLRLVARDLINRTMKGNKGRFVVPIQTVPERNQDGSLSSLLNCLQAVENESVGKEVCPRVLETSRSEKKFVLV